MKQIFLIALSVLMISTAFGQQSADVGLWGGGSSYFGDMTKINTLSSLRPAFGGYLRYNFNPRYGVRLGYITGDVRAEGEYESVEMAFQKRIHDFHVLGEFNFFRYIMGTDRHPITTYLLGGFGASMYDYNYDEQTLSRLGINLVNPNPANYIAYDENLLGLHATVGFGFKFNIGARWGVGAEAQLRKYFNDKLDNLDDPRKSFNSANGTWTTYTDTWHNNDWLVHYGVHVTYRFYIGKKECPVYDYLN